MSDYLTELQEAIARRYAERLEDFRPKLRELSVPDFRPAKGVRLNTFGWLTTLDDLDDDPYAAAEEIVDRIIELELLLVAAVPGARGRVYLNHCHCPRVFHKTPLGTAELMKKTWDANLAQILAEGGSEDEMTPISEIRKEERTVKIRHDFAVQGPDLTPPACPKTPIGPFELSEYPMNPPRLLATR